MVNGGDLYLLKNVFPGFHISGSFNRILCQIWMLLTRFDRDVIDFAVNWAAFFIVSPSAVYYGVARSRAAHGSGPSRYTVCVAKRGFVPLSVRLSNVALVNRSWWERKAVHSILGTEKQPFFDWIRIAMTSQDASKSQIGGNSENVRAFSKFAEFAWFSDKFSDRKILEGLTSTKVVHCSMVY